MGYVYVKIFLGTPVHQGASLQDVIIQHVIKAVVNMVINRM